MCVQLLKWIEICAYKCPLCRSISHWYDQPLSRVPGVWEFVTSKHDEHVTLPYPSSYSGFFSLSFSTSTTKLANFVTNIDKPTFLLPSHLRNWYFNCLKSTILLSRCSWSFRFKSCTINKRCDWLLPKVTRHPLFTSGGQQRAAQASKMAAFVRNLRALPVINLSFARQTALRATGNACLLKVRCIEQRQVQPYSSLKRHLPKTGPISGQVRHYSLHFSYEEIEQQVFYLLSCYAKVDLGKLEKLGVKCRFKEDLGLNSLDMTDIMLAVEDNFQFEIPDNTAEEVQNVGDVIRFVAIRYDAYPLDEDDH